MKLQVNGWYWKIIILCKVTQDPENSTCSPLYVDPIFRVCVLNLE